MKRLTIQIFDSVAQRRGEMHLRTLCGRPAQASRVLRPARLLARQKWTLSQGLDPTDQSVRSTGKIARQLPCQPMTTWVTPSATGDLRRWDALNSAGEGPNFCNER